VTYEDSQADRARPPKSLVVRVSDADCESASFEAGRENKDAEHLHTMLQYGELFVDNGDLAMTQCVDQSFDDRGMRDWNVSGC
jgi:hypothetical protein